MRLPQGVQLAGRGKKDEQDKAGLIALNTAKDDDAIVRHRSTEALLKLSLGDLLGEPVGRFFLKQQFPTLKPWVRCWAEIDSLHHFHGEHSGAVSRRGRFSTPQRLVMPVFHTPSFFCGAYLSSSAHSRRESAQAHLRGVSRP